jgi:hypothetical protein
MILGESRAGHSGERPLAWVETHRRKTGLILRRFNCVGESGDPGEYHDELDSDEGTVSGSAPSSAGWLVKEQNPQKLLVPFFAILSIVALIPSACSDFVAAVGAEPFKRRESGTS